MNQLILRWKHTIIFPGLFMAALLSRLSALGRYITPDELIWVFRVVQFRQALLARQWADTLVSGHPGLTTTWLGALGIWLQLLLRPADRVVYDWLTHLAFFMPDNMIAFSQLATFLTSARLMVALVNSLGVVAVYGLARPLFGRSPALLAALLLALDPFVAGLSGLLHVDGLMSTFVALALLALLGALRPAFSPRHRRRYAILSGVMAAAAVLTKTPALLLAPLTGLFFFFSLFGKGGNGAGRFRNWRPVNWRLTVSNAIIWLLVFLGVILVAYPALWSAPGEALRLLSGNASRHIGSALRPTYFLGRVAYDHDLIFYPVVLIFRLSPAVLLGVVLAVYFWLRRDGRSVWQFRATSLLLSWAVLYIVGISFAAKKFDRYALVVIPALTILAAIAWVQLAGRKPRLGRYLWGVLAVIQVVYWLAFLRYPLAAYNPLAGGPFMAQEALPLGWGEAIGASGRWLAAQPGAEGKTAVSSIAPSFAPFFPGQTLLAAPENIARADYVILTANDRQLNPGDWPPLPDDFILLHTIHYGGLDQAWIYAQPNPQEPDLTLTDLSEPVSFNNQVRLLATKAAVGSDTLDFYARWQLEEGGANGRYTLKLSLRDPAGQVWAGREADLVNAVYFYPEHWTPGETPELHYAIELPPGLPPANYELELTLFDGVSGAQLPVMAGGALQGVAYTYPDIVVTSPVEGVPDIPVITDAALLDGRLVLRGHSALPESIVSGGTAVLDLYWQSTKLLPGGVTLALALGDSQPLTFPLSRYGSGQWRSGERIHEKVNLAVPPEQAAGTYTLRLWLLDEDGTALEETAVSLGQIEIIATDRLFALPDGIQTPLDYAFGNDIYLRGLDWKTAAAAPGDAVALTLYWQTETQPDALYSAFVHLIGPSGLTVAQADRWPGGLPSDTWAGGQVIVDEYAISLPPDAPPGDYQAAVGLYTAVDGQRLPAVDAGGTAVPDNRVLLPITLTVGDGAE